MSTKLERLSENLRKVLGDAIRSLKLERKELTLEVAASDYLGVMQQLNSHPDLCFEQMMDLAGTDYSTYRNQTWRGRRFANVVHLLSLKHNRRVRVRVFAENDDFPTIGSIVSIWPCANWYEREAFDLFGIMYVGHPDLRRILTDYGFIGHPLRKDFPVEGQVEMIYDPEQQRVIYRPTTIEPRENMPRIVREAHYGDTSHG